MGVTQSLYPLNTITTMGLFNFVKNAGEKAIDKIDTAKENVSKEQLMMNIATAIDVKVDNLSVDVKDDVVFVSGEAATQEDKEKLILALGNVEGIASVNDDSLNAPEAPAATFYTVQKGDSLSKIAKAHYGDAMKYPMIFEANRPMLKDPNKIYPGQSLRIPNLDAA